MNQNLSIDTRTGARRMADVPADVLKAIHSGTAETVNLMEWLAADMSALAKSVAMALPVSHPLRIPLSETRGQIDGVGVTGRLRFFGDLIACELEPESIEFAHLASHSSDIVRQWASYAVNSSHWNASLEQRLARTRPFAEDQNMSVRETAWMSFRPHLQGALTEGLDLLTVVAGSENENFRRFAVEVSRPRSVWGAHIDRLKADPGIAVPLLDKTVGDQARYVQLAVGNWINDASKTSPEWAIKYCEEQLQRGAIHQSIVRRGMRTLIRRGKPSVRLSTALKKAVGI